jgi:hypothetical protein
MVSRSFDIAQEITLTGRTDMEQRASRALAHAGADITGHLRNRSVFVLSSFRSHD